MMWNTQEYVVVLGCLCTGMLLGFLYDLFTLLRLPFHSKITDALLDALFYVCALLLCAFSLLVFNDGKVRFYSLFSILLGCYLFMRVPSRFVRNTLRRLTAKIHKK